MITLKEAYNKVLYKHPKEYVHHVNEYNNYYQFILLNEGEKITDNLFIFNTPAVNKQTGELINDATIVDDIFKGNYERVSLSPTEESK